MKENFVAIDLETANAERSSICQIGITEVVDGKPLSPKSWLVQPEGNVYDSVNIWIHGIKPEDTKDCPQFPEVWNEVKPYLQNKTVVAHNTSFDMYALRDAFNKYKMTYPSFDYYCSLRIARYVVKGCYSYSLDIIANHLGLEFGVHHKADSDSLGCALVLLKCLNIENCSLDELEAKYNFHRGKFEPNTFVAQQQKQTQYQYLTALESHPDLIDKDNYFYGKSVCFTGKMMFGIRKELLQMVKNVGGIPTDSVTKETNILVVGQQDYRIVGSDGMSSKQKKAMKLIDSGYDIEILSETEFISRI